MFRKFSRRRFLIMALGAGGGAVLAACARAPEPVAPEVEASPEPGSAEGPAAEPQEVAAGDVETGYYNLEDFQARTGKVFDKYDEAPMLAERVANGELPPVEERLPDSPLVFRTLDKVGEYGGMLRVESVNIEQDWHLRHINAANLFEMPPSAGWDCVSTVYGAPSQPGILESFSMSDDGLVFSATIRRGLKWSDGVPVTTEDVSFKVNDVLLNKQYSPVAAQWLVWGGGTTELQILDESSFELRFSAPYGSFIEAELRMWPGTFQRLLLPKHYLTQYHIDYAPEDELLEKIKEAGLTSIDEWPQFFGDKAALFGCDNANMDMGKVFPTLNPYVFVQDLGNGGFLLERNPYFHMVDQDGNQLPYIDQLRRSYVSDAEMQNMSIIAGDVDLSCMSIAVDSFPVYKQHEQDGNYKALLLSDWQDQLFIVGFNEFAGIRPPQLESVGMTPIENPASDDSYDPGISEVYGDVRFRRAMSLALDRETMNEALFMGLGRPAQVAPRPHSPFYEEGMEESYVQYDPEGAKALLDEMGMTDQDGDGWRERPDGKPFTMKYDYFVITGASTPGSELCKRYWEDVGIKVEMKLVDVAYWSNLAANNINEVTTWWLAGSDANLLQNWFLGPSMLVPLWNRYTSYKGQVSDEDWEVILQYVPEWQREMQNLKEQIKIEADDDRRAEIARRMWQLQAEWLPIIGVATDTKSPMIVSTDLDNVWMAEDENYNYITMMEASDCWFFSNPARRE